MSNESPFGYETINLRARFIAEGSSAVAGETEDALGHDAVRLRAAVLAKDTGIPLPDYIRIGQFVASGAAEASADAGSIPFSATQSPADED
jgi:hypothetical protein